MEPNVSSLEKEHTGYPIKERILVTVTAIGSILIETIDSTVVNVGLPKMMGGLSATVDEIAWVITAYSIGNVLMIPMTRFMGDRLGRRFYFTGSILLFTVFSYFCAISTSLFLVVLFRFLQGLSGAAFFSTSQTLLIEAFPKEQIGLANSIFAVGFGLGPALGPVIGGYIVYHQTWPWMFYINIPIGVVLTILSWRSVRNSPYALQDEKADLWGIGLLLIGVPALQIFLEEGQRYNWFSSTLIQNCFIIWVTALPLFVLRQLTAKHPLINLRVLKNRSVMAGSLSLLMIGTVYFGTLFTVPLVGQNLLGWNPLETGVTLFPGIIAFALISMLMGGLIGKIMLKPIMIIGVILVEISLYQLSFFSPDVSPSEFFYPLIFRGLGLACLFPPVMTLAMATIPRQMVASGAAIVSMMGQVGGALGIAIITTLMQQWEQVHRSYLSVRLTEPNPIFQAAISRMGSIFQSHGVTFGSSRRLAMGLLNQILDSQSLFLTFSDLFRIMGAATLSLIVFIYIFERTSLSHPDLK